MIIETPRLRLRRPVKADADSIFQAYASDAEVTRFLAWPRHRAIADTLNFIVFSDQEWARAPVGPLLMESRETGQLIGTTGIQMESTLYASTGYVLRKSEWGRGYASEALQAMTELAPRLGLNQLYALCHPDHTASQHVLEKCGFVRQRVLPRFVAFPNINPDRKIDTLRFVRSFG